MFTSDGDNNADTGTIKTAKGISVASLDPDLTDTIFGTVVVVFILACIIGALLGWILQSLFIRRTAG